MQEQIYTLIADFSVKGNLAYLSHKETLKMFQRAFIRASVPLKFSCGFNPHPQLSMPLPRSVGTQSQEDRICAIVTLSQLNDFKNLQDEIQKHLPDDCNVHRLRFNEGKCTFYPQGVVYRFFFNDIPDREMADHISECERQVLASAPIEVRRYNAKKRKYKHIDISTYIETLSMSGDCIDVSCRVGPSGTVRVDEIMQWLKIDPSCLKEPVARTQIHWNQN